MDRLLVGPGFSCSGGGWGWGGGVLCLVSKQQWQLRLRSTEHSAHNQRQGPHPKLGHDSVSPPNRADLVQDNRKDETRRVGVSSGQGMLRGRDALTRTPT